MSKIISIHSFRGGTGKSNITANVAIMVAQPGKREGVIDTDIQSPGIHVLFGLDEEKMDKCLNDYLWGKCARGGSLRCGAHFEDG
jgi:MinD-like ATPase involved in chromosome partitioning or flagellar assembly